MLRRRLPASWVVGINLLAFHLNYPIIFAFYQRYLEDPEISIELFTALPVALLGALHLFSLILPARSHAARRPLLWLALFVGWCVLGEVINGHSSFYNLKNPVALLLIAAGSVVLFKWHWGSIHPKLRLIIYIVVIAFSGFMGYEILGGALEFLPSGRGEDLLMRYQVLGLASTELTLFLASQLCYLGFLLQTRPPRTGSQITLALIAVNVAATFYSGSKGALAALFLMALYYFRRVDLWKRLLIVGAVIIVGMSGTASLSYYLSSYQIQIEQQMQGTLEQDQTKSARVALYEAEWGAIQQYPLFGLGLGQFWENRVHDFWTGQVPHQNLLGIACENGIPATVFYALFIFASAIGLYRAQHRLMPYVSLDPSIRSAALFIEASLIVFLVFQFRGFFADTWTLKEMYFLVGAGFGTSAWAEARVSELQQQVHAGAVNGAPQFVYS
jgi:O-antigen ligase